MLYAHVEAGVIDRLPRGLPRAWGNISGIDHMDAAALKAIGWYPVRNVDPAFDPPTQVRTGPVLTVDTDEVVQTWTVRDKTAQELADYQREQDLSDLRAAGKDLALVLTELVDWTLANTAMQPTDFSANVKQAYLDLKTIADRVK